MHKWVVVFLAVVVTSCATPYRDVDASQPYSTLSFARGYTTGTGFGAGTNQEYSLARAGACENITRAAMFNYLTGAANDRRVAAGEPVHLFANTAYSASSGAGGYVTTTIQWCVASATFTPEAGRTYRVIQRELALAACRLEIVDAATGTPPADLSITEGSGCLPSGEPVGRDR